MADDDLCPRCGRDMTGASVSGKRSHIDSCTDTPPPGYTGQRWVRTNNAKHRKGKH